MSFKLRLVSAFLVVLAIGETIARSSSHSDYWNDGKLELVKKHRAGEEHVEIRRANDPDHTWNNERFVITSDLDSRRADARLDISKVTDRDEDWSTGYEHDHFDHDYWTDGVLEVTRLNNPEKSVIDHLKIQRIDYDSHGGSDRVDIILRRDGDEEYVQVQRTSSAKGRTEQPVIIVEHNRTPTLYDDAKTVFIDAPATVFGTGVRAAGRGFFGI